MAQAQTKVTKRAYPDKESAKRGALSKQVRGFKLAVARCENALAERVKAGEKEIVFFEKELEKAEKGLAAFEAGVKAAAAKE